MKYYPAVYLLYLIVVLTVANGNRNNLSFYMKDTLATNVVSKYKNRVVNIYKQRGTETVHILFKYIDSAAE